MHRTLLIGLGVLVASSLSVSEARAQTSPTPAPHTVDVTTLRLLRDKNVITQAEYESAVRDIGESTGSRAADANTLVVGRWSTTVYGFVEADSVFDSTESFSEAAGNGLVERPDPHPAPPPAAPVTYKGDHGRMTFGVRNSRFGFRMRAPEIHGARVSAQLEMDFLGQQPAIGSSQPYQSSESSYFTSPAVRVRHANFKIETSVVDILAGQYWQLFGWQNVFHPNTVEIQGVPGQVYGRTPQLRLSKTIKGSAVTVEVAVALSRPAQRDSIMPTGDGGLRLAINKWVGMNTAGATATSLMPASIAVTGNVKQISLPEFQALPKNSVERTMSAVAVDAFVPIVPATEATKGNSLSLTGELVSGYGTSDLYTGLTGGMALPTVANTTNQNPAPTYPQNIDNGIAVFDLKGGLHPIQWTSYLVGLQYYLPGLAGKAWVSANYSHLQSANAHFYTRAVTATLPNPQQSYYVSAAQVRDSIDWFDFNLFADVLESVRVGAEYANFHDRYVDGVTAINHRVQLSGFFLF